VTTRDLCNGVVRAVLCVLLVCGCRPSANESGKVDAKSKSLPPLSAAAKRGDVSLVKKLLSSGADPNAVDPEGGTPLQYATSSAKIEVVRALLAGGANVRANSPDGYSVLHVVAVDREVQIAELLLAAGADVNARTTNGTTPLIASVCSPYSESKMSLTLIRAGADVNIVNSDGETALFCATGREVVEELLKRGANPNIQSTRFSGETPLHKAALNGDKEVVELLLRYGADPTIRNYNGETPLDITNVKFEEVRRILSSRSKNSGNQSQD
jgi:ankyrin repeat protein